MSLDNLTPKEKEMWTSLLDRTNNIDELLELLAKLERSGNLTLLVKMHYPQYLLPDGKVAKFLMLEDLGITNPTFNFNSFEL